MSSIKISKQRELKRLKYSVTKKKKFVPAEQKSGQEMKIN